jgi:hypothetical protein
MRNKLLLLLLVAPMSVCLGATRNCTGTSQSDVNICINGGPNGSTGTDSTGHQYQKAPDGEIINLLATPSVTWATPITVDKNVQIIGAGTGTGGTHINGGQIFILVPHPGTNQPRMIVSNIHINKDRAAAPTFKLVGVCPINDAFASDPTKSGGFQITGCLITGTTVSAGHLFEISGWPEGVIDHNVVDLPFDSNVDGEWIILNFHGTPTSTNCTPGNACGSGFWAWTHPPPLMSNHLITLEDNIFHRHGAIDSNQWAVGQAGGAMYRARHNTVWHGLSGHGGPADSHVWGIRFEDAHKNLYIRGIDEGAGIQGQNAVDVRGGEAVAWGNRFNRYGTDLSAAQSPFQIECNVISSGLADDMTGPPDGMNPWFLNQKGSFTVGSNSYAPMSGYNRANYNNPWLGTCSVVNGVDTPASGNQGATGLLGDVYLGCNGSANCGGVMTTDAFSFYLKDSSGTPISGQPTNKWKDFMCVNLAKTPGLSSGPANPFGNPGGTCGVNGWDCGPSAQDYAYIDGNSEQNVSGVGTVTVFHRLRTGLFDAKPSEWAITNGNGWELRRVKPEGFLNAPGRGSGDTLVDNATAGASAASRNALRLVSGTVPNPRWINQPNNIGVREWDNLYRRTVNGSFTPIIGWGISPTGICFYACGQWITTGSGPAVAAGYTYSATTPIGAATGGTSGASGTEVRPETRVGADSVAWAKVPANGFIAATDANCPNLPGCEGVDSLYTLGSGGPPYPHPFVVAQPVTPTISVSAPTFIINGTDDCANNKNCAKITTSNFSSTPTITISAWDQTLNNVALSIPVPPDGTATVHGTAASNTAGTYTTTVHATNGSQTATDFTLQLLLQNGNSPPTVDQVTLTPANGPYLTTTSITLTADAQDSDDGVSKVEFYDDNGVTNSCLNCVTPDILTPYTYTSTFAAGSHSFTAKAYDSTTSTVSDPPTAITVATPAPPATPAKIIVSP